MKLKDEFMLCEIAGENIVVPFGSAKTDLRGMLRLNETGVSLWKMLEEGAEENALAQMLVDRFGAEAMEAASDVKEFLKKLKAAGCLQ